MESNNYLLMNSSILYRCTQKYYDKQLNPYEIGAGQLQFLIMIYEEEGITMQALANKGNFDKGTITKGIQKLEDLGYVRSVVNEQDKRVRCLYTTDKTKDIIGSLYLIRRDWWERITKDITLIEAELFESLLQKIAESASQYMVEEEKEIAFFGMQKLTLLDYPGKMACTLFTGGCNFKCPFCHNADLVFLPENMVEIKGQDVLDYLKKRQGILEGVCISGGEPLLHDEIEPFLRKVKALGYPIKLDTNGCFPDKIKYLVKEGLIDYVAMDIKNSFERYPETIGTQTIYIEAMKESIDYLLSGAVDYEFRTTMVKEFHTIEDISAIGKMLKGAKRYYLQNFIDGERVIQKGLHGFAKEELEAFAKVVKPYIETVEIRGI